MKEKLIIGAKCVAVIVVCVSAVVLLIGFMRVCESLGFMM